MKILPRLVIEMTMAAAKSAIEVVIEQERNKAAQDCKMTSSPMARAVALMCILLRFVMNRHTVTLRVS